MPEVGEVYTTTVTLSTESFTEINAPTGEQIKVTMTYAKDASDGTRGNQGVSVAPAVGDESTAFGGSESSNKANPVIGGNFSAGSGDFEGIQPTYITDSDGLFIGNSSHGSEIEVIVQGVRVA